MRSTVHHIHGYNKQTSPWPSLGCISGSINQHSMEGPCHFSDGWINASFINKVGELSHSDSQGYSHFFVIHQCYEGICPGALVSKLVLSSLVNSGAVILLTKKWSFKLNIYFCKDRSFDIENMPKICINMSVAVDILFTDILIIIANCLCCSY